MPIALAQIGRDNVRQSFPSAPFDPLPGLTLNFVRDQKRDAVMVERPALGANHPIPIVRGYENAGNAPGARGKQVAQDKTIHSGLVGMIRGDYIGTAREILQTLDVDPADNVFRKENLNQADGPPLRANVFRGVAQFTAQQDVNGNRGSGKANQPERG